MSMDVHGEEVMAAVVAEWVCWWWACWEQW